MDTHREAEFRDLEESMWRAETRFDRGYVERLLHPDFFEFGRSGRVWLPSHASPGHLTRYACVGIR